MQQAIVSDLRSNGGLILRVPNEEAGELLERVVRHSFERVVDVVPTSAGSLMRDGQPEHELKSLLGGCDAAEEGSPNPALLWIRLESSPAWDAGRWWRFVESLAARNRDPATRSVTLVVLTVGDDDRDPAVNTAIAERWWWGILSRGDSHYAIARELDLPDALVACAVEVGQFDVNLSLDLARAGAAVGRIDERLIREVIGPARPDQVRVALVGESNGLRPHAASVDAWKQGDVEYWDGRERAHIRSHRDASHDEVARLLWQGQIAALYGVIEEHRRIVGRWLGHNEHHLDAVDLEAAIAEDHHASSVEDLGLGAMARLLDSPAALHLHDPARRKLVSDLAYIRNSLAHGRPVSASRMRRAAEAATAVHDKFRVP